MRLIETGIPGLVVIEPDVHGDERGYFMELWRATPARETGLPDRFAQCNISRSVGGVIRGLHFQYPNPQGKLVAVLEGSVFDVGVDIRTDSPTFRRWAGVELSSANHRLLYVPEGFAHGFCVLGPVALIAYLCTAEYSADADAAIAWDDPDIGIDWPRQPTQLSGRDRAAPRLREFAPEDLPRMLV